MRVVYRDRALERLCTEEKVAQKELGKPCAKKLKRRLADLMAAESPTELLAGNPHPLKGERDGQFAVTLQGGKRLCFEPYHDPVPTKSDGGLDWGRVTAIMIVYIGDYHD